MFRFLRLFQAFPNLHMLTDIIVIKEDKYRKGNDVKPLVEHINECDIDTVFMVDLATSELLPLSIQSAFQSYFIKR